MSDEDGHSLEIDEELEHELTALAPVVRRRRQAEAKGIDLAFALALEQRLLGVDGQLPAHAVARPSRVRFAGLAAGVLAVAAVVAILLLRHPGSASTRVAFVPRPSTIDLTRDYPRYTAGGGGGGMEEPITNPMTISGGAYPAHLRLSASHLPATPRTLPAYRLAGPSFTVPRAAHLARKLGIPATVTFWNDLSRVVPRSQATWVVAAIHAPPSRLPLHSLAISLDTGELLYHDLHDVRSASPGGTLGKQRAVAIARAWLTRLGWPGKTMPVISVAPPTNTGATSANPSLEVSLGWTAAGRSNVPAATLWLTSGGKVSEAFVWPPVVKRQTVSTRDVTVAWNMVRAGKAAIGLYANVPGPFPGGVGTVTQVGIIQVLITPRVGAPYLVPAYRFAGTVQLSGGQGKHRWYALTPATGP